MRRVERAPLFRIERHEIENTNIVINIKNKGFLRNELIGSFEMNTTSIYFRDRHALEHQWIAMFNPESEDISEITANLRVSFHIMTKGDEQIQLSAQSEPDRPEAQLLIPPFIRESFKQLKISFLKAEHLPKLDSKLDNTLTFKSSNIAMNVYFECTYFGKKLETKVKDAPLGNAEIYQEFWIPVRLPLTMNRLVIVCKDWDLLTHSYEIAGSMVFEINNLLEMGAKKGGTMYWQNLQGAPEKAQSNEHKDRMNNHPEFASEWHGRILLHIVAEDCKIPQMKIKEVNEEIKTQAIANKMFEKDEYDVIAEFGAGISLPTKESQPIKYKVKIQIGEFEITTKEEPEEATPGFNRWSYRSEQQLFSYSSNYLGIKGLEHVYIYLMEGETPVCFWKGDISQFDITQVKEPKLQWFTLTNDLAVGQVTNRYEAGMVQVKLSISSRAQNKGPFIFATQSRSWIPRPIDYNSKRIRYGMRILIYQCRNIPSADDDGLSDCFVEIWHDQEKGIRTKTVVDSLNPIFYQQGNMYYDMSENTEEFTPLIFNLWDDDGDLRDKNKKEYLGSAVLQLNESATNIINYKEKELEFKGKKRSQRDDLIEKECSKIPTPKWIDIRHSFDANSPVTGQLLVSVVIAKYDFVFKPVVFQELIKRKEHELCLHVLGLRNLQSTGILPVQKAFIRFNIKSMLPPYESAAVRNIQTQPNQAGSNPNINSTIRFVCQLPVDDLYCPSLTCEVFDFIFKGLSQPTIGSFSIDISEIRRRSREEIKEQIEIQESIIADLKKILPEDGKIKEWQLKLMTEQVLLGQKTKITAQAISSLVAQNKQKTETKETTIPEKELSDEETPLLQEDRNLQNLQVDEQNRQAQARTEKETAPASKEMQGKGTETLSKSEKQREELKIKILESELRKQKEKEDFYEKLKQIKIVEMIKAPQYIKDPEKEGGYVREDPKTIPDYMMYQKVGFNDKETVDQIIKIQAESESIVQKKKLISVTKMHYRFCIKNELEKCDRWFPRQTFKNYDLVRGQQRGNMSILGFLYNSKRDSSGELDSRRTVGRFKGIISVMDKEEKDKLKSKRDKNLQKIYDLIKKPYQTFFNIGTLEDFKRNINGAQPAPEFHSNLKTLKIDDHICKKLFEMGQHDPLVERKFNKVSATVDLYMLKGFDFAQQDIGSKSDPYLIIECDNQKFNERNNYQLDQSNPTFNKCFQFNVWFPGAACIVISAYDYDDLFGDEFIGKTTIDLDDRFYSNYWQAHPDKPIEFRQLYTDSSNLSQGVVSCWLDIEPVEKQTQSACKKKWDLTEEPSQEFEARVSVIECTSVPSCDEGIGGSDLYIQCWIDEKQKKSTDTHYRCLDGNGSFNYRCLLDFDFSTNQKQTLVLQAWDRDLFKSNDFICEWVLDISLLTQQASYRRCLMKLDKKFYENVVLKYQAADTERKADKKQEVATKDQAQIEKEVKPLKLEFIDDYQFELTQIIQTGKHEGREVKIRLDIRVVAKKYKGQSVGEGRNEPNFEPYLPAPVGRLSFSWNPINMLTQFVSKEILNKAMCAICTLLCCIAFICMIPLILSDVIGAIVVGLF